MNQPATAEQHRAGVQSRPAAASGRSVTIGAMAVVLILLGLCGYAAYVNTAGMLASKQAAQGTYGTPGTITVTDTGTGSRSPC